MRTIQGKTAIITGGASGIGKAIALQLAAEGARLYLIDIDGNALTQAVGELKQQGAEVLGRQCDVSDSQALASTGEHAMAHCQSIDILVNNAGIAYYGETAAMSPGDAQRLLQVNLHAPIELTRQLLPQLLSREEAHVLNVASFLGLIGSRRLALYSASKFGLVGFSESLRAEYGRHGLGVTALCPGFVDTGLFESAPLGTDREAPKLPPRWILTTPEKIAQRAVRAIYRNRAVDVSPFYARLAHLGKRLVPGLLDWANHLSRKRKYQVSQSVDERPSLPDRAA